MRDAECPVSPDHHAGVSHQWPPAKGKGDAALAEAKGVADVLRVKGEAESAYNAKVSGSLTSVLIQQQYLAKWDGRLPQYSFGGGVTPLIQMPGGSDPPRR